MKGYFSQLARHTGLRFPNGANATSPAAGTQRPAPASPLHVEDVTFVPPTATTLGPNNLDVVQHRTPETTQTTQTHTAEPRTPSAFSEPPSAEVQLSAPQTEPRESTATPIETKDVRPLSTEHQSPFPGPNVERDHSFEMPVNGAKLEHVEAKLVAPVSETTSALASSHEGDQPKVPAQPVSDLDPRDSVEREVLVRQYLREVRAWVAAPPTPIPDIPENPIVEEHDSTTEWQPQRVTTYAPDRAPLSTSPQPAQPDRIDVHETSLSIGSINIVIEDPKPNVMTIAPAPAAPPAQPQPQSEPTSLSRYYLQRW